MCLCHDITGHVPTRRRLLAAATFTAFAPMARAAGTALPDNRIGGAAALQRLLDGNARYVAGKSRQRDFSAGRIARTKGQKPFAAILSCADSRVAPELVFDQGPGDLFVVRLAGNFVNDDTLASMEYAARFLDVPLFYVLGHANCGAVAAALRVVQENIPLPGHLPALVEALRPGVEAAIARQPADLLAEATVENVRHNTRRLAQAQPVLADMQASGAIAVAGGVYDLATGRVAPV